jgi:hypothetical protein
MRLQLTEEPNILKWNLTPPSVFSVKSMYVDYMNVHIVFLKKYLWKIKIPLKIMIFMWFLHIKVVLTKDNLAKRNWNICTKSVFCDISQETISQLVRSIRGYTYFLWSNENL